MSGDTGFHAKAVQAAHRRNTSMIIKLLAIYQFIVYIYYRQEYFQNVRSMAKTTGPDVKTKVTTRGQTSIPAVLRRQFQITARTELDWQVEDGRIVVYPVPEDPYKAYRGLLKGSGPAVADLLAHRRADRDFEG